MTELSVDRVEISTTAILLFQDKYNAEPCFPIFLTFKWLE